MEWFIYETVKMSLITVGTVRGKEVTVIRSLEYRAYGKVVQ